MVKYPAWPVVTYEPREWSSSLEIPRRWITTFTGPYDAAVVPSIARQQLDLPANLAAVTSEATAALAAFDAEMCADVAPFAAILLRSESASSSRIERLTASAKAIALAELGSRDRRNAVEIAANTAAMRAAIDLAEQLDADAIIRTHQALLGDIAPGATGAWRDQQVWIGASSYGPHTASFVPPHHDHIAAAIGDLVAFMQRDDLPVLVQAALAHAQFETIHPFVDGNGRTGRALIHSMLRAKGVTNNITVPVSAGLLIDIDGYFGALDEYRVGDPYPIIERLAEATFAAVHSGRRLVGDLRSIRDSWKSVIHARTHAAVWQLIDLVLRQPVLDSALVQSELGVTAPTADASIALLVEAELLVQFTEGRRNRKYEAPQILAALDAFAESTARRTR